MKIRYWVAGYTAFMLLLFLYLMHIFISQPINNKDMVYYNEQKKLIEEAMNQGVERERIEQEFECQLLFRNDETYEMDLQSALKKEALILDYFEKDTFKGKIIWNENEKQYKLQREGLYKQTALIWLGIVLAGYFLLGFLYVRMIRPFHKLQTFSKQVAKGNLDFPLLAGKHDYFGAFTESFDLMREELKRARESEYQANKSKKELVAELSHDIKTPIATIQATCEVMQIKEKNPETLKKVSLIDSKAKMIQKLIDNLFHATLQELTVLKVEPTEESSLCIADMFHELEYYEQINLTKEIPQCLVYMDKLRLQQVIDNCINNAWKYAQTAVDVSFEQLEKGIQIRIKDSGQGVLEDELPLILEKFYRGSNAKGKEGSGLGLYLARLFMKQMNGDLECYNENGFVVSLFLKKVGSE